MTDRIRKLRERSLAAKPSLSTERAVLLTRFHQSGVADAASSPVRRALAFRYLMERKSICIEEMELIVGERGESPKATPTFPELCAHTLNDLDILNSRDKISFSVSREARRIYECSILPFWKGKTMRDRVFAQMSDPWKEAYTAGVFTEFMEQRAPGHTVLDDKIYRKGMNDFKKDVRRNLDDLDFIKDPNAYRKREELRAMAICADALISFGRRHSRRVKALAGKESDDRRKRELLEIARICEKVPARAPETFHEALQHYWFVHLGVISELNTWDSFNPGRLDQHLLPFYRAEIRRGSLTEERAKELLQAFWIKFNNQPAPPKVGVTAEESSTYTDFALINLGGVREDGADAVNELTFLILDVIEEMRLLQPSSMVQISKKTPDRLLRKAIGIIKTGYGQPSIFNTDALIQEMLRQGKSLFDARNGGASGCVETGAFGKESYILTGYFNLPKILEITLHNGCDPRTGKRLGLVTGNPSGFKKFDGLLDAFRRQVAYFADIKMKGSNVIERLFAEFMPAPFLSLLIDDCVAKGRDYHDGGARYNTSYIQGVGLGSVTDSLASIRCHVFEKKELTLAELNKVLAANFAEHETWRQRFSHQSPKYGNDRDEADEVMRMVFEAFYEAVNGKPNTRDGFFRINMLPTTCHVYFGKVTGATADGRRAGEPLSEGISPVQGMDRLGPTAVIRSAAKMDHLRTGGTLLNLKFTPQILADDEGVTQFAHLVRSYFKLDGHHVQFNVVDAATLRDAQRHPEQYRNLIVRVAGYSDYFVDLGTDLQNEIIRRTGHGRF
jgi:trans-4-hydroxy-L-proline dehydratase